MWKKKKPPCHRSAVAPTAGSRVSLSHASSNDKTATEVFTEISIIIYFFTSPGESGRLHFLHYSLFFCFLHGQHPACSVVSIAMAARAHDDWAFQTRTEAVRETTAEFFNESLFTTFSFLFFTPSFLSVSFLSVLSSLHLFPFLIPSHASYSSFPSLSVFPSCWCKVTASLSLYNVRDGFYKGWVLS